MALPCLSSKIWCLVSNNPQLAWILSSEALLTLIKITPSMLLVLSLRSPDCRKNEFQRLPQTLLHRRSRPAAFPARTPAPAQSARRDEDRRSPASHRPRSRPRRRRHAPPRRHRRRHPLRQPPGPGPPRRARPRPGPARVGLRPPAAAPPRGPEGSERRGAAAMAAGGTGVAAPVASRDGRSRKGRRRRRRRRRTPGT